MNRFTKFFHELVHPHCPDCMQDEMIKTGCKTCPDLRDQLEKANQRERELLQLLIERNKPQPEIEIQKDLQPIRPRAVPWHLKQRELEAQDRKQAQILREQAKLEKEMNLEVVDEDATGTEKTSS